jgi:transcription elongation factor Elf1
MTQNITDMSSLDLSAPVDVYSDWIDACDAVAKETGSSSNAPPTSSVRMMPQSQPSAHGEGPGGEDEYEKDDGFIDDEDADPEADFADD